MTRVNAGNPSRKYPSATPTRRHVTSERSRVGRIQHALFSSFLLLALLCTTTNAFAEPEADYLDVLPLSGTVLPTNARLWTFGGSMDGAREGAVQCDDDEGSAVDCVGAPLSLSLVGARTYFGEIVFAAEFARLEAGQNVLVDVFQNGTHVEGRYTVDVEADEEPPTAPTNLTAQAEVRYVGGTGGQDEPTMHFSWEGSTDNTQVIYYRVERIVDGEMRLATLRRASSGTHRAGIRVDEGEIVTAEVRAVDIAGNISAPTEQVTTVGDFMASPACECATPTRGDFPTGFAGFLVGIALLRKRRLKMSWGRAANLR